MAGRQGRRRFGAIRRLPSGRYQVRYRTADSRYVTDQPEVRYTESGIARATFRVAVSGRREQEASSSP
jgi:hypothetical protein